MRRAMASVDLAFNSSRQALAVFDAVKPETKLPPTQRSCVEIHRRGRSIHIVFEAKDVVALRASMNSILRYILGLWKTTASLGELEKNSGMSQNSTSVKRPAVSEQPFPKK